MSSWTRTLLSSSYRSLRRFSVDLFWTDQWSDSWSSFLIRHSHLRFCRVRFSRLIPTWMTSFLELRLSVAVTVSVGMICPIWFALNLPQPWWEAHLPQMRPRCAWCSDSHSFWPWSEPVASGPTYSVHRPQSWNFEGIHRCTLPYSVNYWCCPSLSTSSVDRYSDSSPFWGHQRSQHGIATCSLAYSSCSRWTWFYPFLIINELDYYNNMIGIACDLIG